MIPYNILYYSLCLITFVFAGKTCNGSSLPTTIVGGVRITYQEYYFFEDEVEYVCDFGTSAGDTTAGTQSLKCMADGSWENTLTEIMGMELLNCTSMYYSFLLHAVVYVNCFDRIYVHIMYNYVSFRRCEVCTSESD